MNKYIRTKDGRIAEVKDNMFIKETTIEIINQKGLRLVYKDRPDSCVLNGSEDYIIKQADTIEELCDEFVGIRKSDNTAHLGKIEDKHWFYEQTGWVGRVENYKVIYGAIWTDIGLIYVAKMNDKGELELL